MVVIVVEGSLGAAGSTLEQPETHSNYGHMEPATETVSSVETEMQNRDNYRSEGFPARDISSLHAMG